MQTIDTDIWRETPGFGTYIQQLALTGGTARQYTVPTGAEWLRVTYTAGVLYAKTAANPTAVVPVADITDGTGSNMVLQGEARTVTAGQIISFINGTSCVVIFELRGTGVKA